MSYDTETSLVQYGDWDAKSDSHPAMKFMHAYTNKVDENDFQALWNEGIWAAQDFTYRKSTGESFPPGKESMDAVGATYQFFTKFYHEPTFFTCFEKGDGWAMIGNANLYYNLPGDASGSGTKDAQGRDWQASLPAGFYFEYVKNSAGKDGVLMSVTDITSDSGPIVVELLRRGIMTPKDLGL